MQFDPYLNFDGQTTEAFRFYEQVFGGKVEAMMRFSESPMADQVGPEWQDRIMHARLVVGDQVLMASDSPPGQYRKPEGLWVSINVEQPKEAERIFRALAEKGTVQMPFEKTFWAAGGFGMLVDRFGTPWMINCANGA
jgi:PhnB protein